MLQGIFFFILEKDFSLVFVQCYLQAAAISYLVLVQLKLKKYDASLISMHDVAVL